MSPFGLKILLGHKCRFASVEVDADDFHPQLIEESDLIVDALFLSHREVFVSDFIEKLLVFSFQVGAEFVLVGKKQQIRSDRTKLAVNNLVLKIENAIG